MLYGNTAPPSINTERFIERPLLKTSVTQDGSFLPHANKRCKNMIGFVPLVRLISTTVAALLVIDSFLQSSLMTAALLDSDVFQDKKTRWYLIHSLVNGLVVILVLPDIRTVLSDPVANGLTESYTDTPLAITVGLHIFHCFTSYKTLSILDWAHHLIGNMLVCALCFPFHYGPLVNWAAFFVCGFPGGIDYFLLFLCRIGAMEPIQEKRVNRVLNMYIRAPGIISFVSFAYCSLRAGLTSVPTYALVAQGILNGMNGLYFADRVVANTAIVDWCSSNNIDKGESEAFAKVKNQFEAASAKSHIKTMEKEIAKLKATLVRGAQAKKRE